jgi:hypothetical protein
VDLEAGRERPAGVGRVLLTTKQQRTPEEECILERLEGGEEVELHDRLSEEAAKLLKRQRRRRRGELNGSSPPFDRQVGKLAAQTPRQREVTIADWRRRIRQRRPPAGPARDAFGFVGKEVSPWGKGRP